MSAKRPMRLIAVLVVLATLLVTGLAASWISGCASSAVIDTAGTTEGTLTYYQPPKQCPPADGSDWWLDHSAPVATSGIWVVLDINQNTCGFTPLPHGFGSAGKACAYTQPDGLGVVYSIVPRWALTESYIHHEECHWLGYVHGPHHGGLK